jgi:hypothetical protein
VPSYAPAALLLAASITLLGGCHAGQKAAAPAAAAALELPAGVAPAPQLAPLTFMVGRWVCVNRNKSVNDEHWTTPRGNHMAALFTQSRRDGKPALVEVSLVTVEADGSVKLSLRHLHAGLEVPDNQKELSILTLASAGDNKAEFKGTGKAANMSVVYRLESPDHLVVDVNFPADSKEKSYSMSYTRER